MEILLFLFILAMIGSACKGSTQEEEKPGRRRKKKWWQA